MARSLQGNLVKRAHAPQKYTMEEIAHLEACMDPVTGPIYFCENFLKIQHPTQGDVKFEPYDYQRRLLHAYHDYTYTIAMLPRQSGKALSLDTKIPTLAGWTTMRNVCEGDIIVGPDGNPTTVTFATEVMHNHTCYNVEFDNGDIITADAEHLWEISTGYWNKQKKIITTDELKKYREKYTKIAIWTDITEPIIGSHLELPIPPYILGLWIGDGSSDGGAYTQSISDNTEMVKFINDTGFEVSSPRPNSPNSEVRTIYNLRGKLVDAGVYKNKHIPDIYLRASIDQRVELLQGLMDTDGSVSDRGHCEFYQKKYHIIDQVRELLSSLGIKSRIGVKTLNDQKYYTIVFTTKKYPVFKLSRKLNRQMLCKNHPKNSRLYIKSISETESVPVRCIQVDNADHLFLCGNTMIRTHNTTCASGYLLWYSMFVPNANILIAAHKYDGAKDIMDRYRYGYENLPDFIRAGCYSYNRQTIEFDNGSRVHATTTTENTGRGKSLSLIYVDEMAFVQPPEKAKEFWTALSPTLSTGGKCIITSTPNSDEDQFAQIWKEANKKFDEHGNEQDVGLNGFFAFTAAWDEHPDRDEKWAQLERAKIGDERFRREFDCEFLIWDETLINADKLLSLEGDEPLRTTGQTRWYKNINPQATYLISLDPSLGTGGDYGAIQVFEMPTMEQVGEWRHNLTPVQGQVRILREICKYIQETAAEKDGNPQIYYSVENNTLGEAALIVIENLGEENFPGLFLSEPQRKGHVRKFRKGFNTTHQTKISACSQLKNLLETDKMKVHSKPLLSELKNFVASGLGFAAKSGETDDLVSSALLIIRMAGVLADWDPQIYDKMTEKLTEESLPMPIYISSGF